MIKKVIITNYLGESIEFELTNPYKTGIYVSSITGLGPGKASINTTDIATDDGSIFNSARSEQRNIVMELGFMQVPGITETIEDARQLTYKFFPKKKPLRFYILTDNRELEIYGYTESNEPDIFSKDEKTQISIICPDPLFYSAGEGGTHTTVFNGVEYVYLAIKDEWKLLGRHMYFLPVIEMGSIEILKERTIYYDGDTETGVIIKIHAIGNAEHIVIYNTGTRERMNLDTDKLTALMGQGLTAGDEITISTVKGNKYITLLRNGREYNILNIMDKNADWFQLAKGFNIFTYTAVYGSSNLQFKILNQVAFEGV